MVRVVAVFAGQSYSSLEGKLPLVDHTAFLMNPRIDQISLLNTHSKTLSNENVNLIFTFTYLILFESFIKYYLTFFLFYKPITISKNLQLLKK